MQAHKHELEADVDISKYIAGGLVVYNLQTRSIKWQLHLDLSTDTTTFRAHIYSSPTLADLNGDGKLEIIIGTSMVRPRALPETSLTGAEPPAHLAHGSKAIAANVPAPHSQLRALWAELGSGQIQGMLPQALQHA